MFVLLPAAYTGRQVHGILAGRYSDLLDVRSEREFPNGGLGVTPQKFIVEIIPNNMQVPVQSQWIHDAIALYILPLTSDDIIVTEQPQ